jgi:hypothetical protein
MKLCEQNVKTKDSTRLYLYLDPNTVVGDLSKECTKKRVTRSPKERQQPDDAAVRAAAL